MRGREWKPVRGFESYEVSRLGQVRGIDGELLVIRPRKKDGYVVVRLYRKQFLVHRIVWETFRGLIPKGLEINHKNTIRDDNSLENLELCTRSENMRHAFAWRRQYGHPRRNSAEGD